MVMASGGCRITQRWAPTYTYTKFFQKLHPIKIIWRCIPRFPLRSFCLQCHHHACHHEHHECQYRSQLLPECLLEHLGMPSMWIVSLADPKGYQGCAPCPQSPNSFIFMQFSARKLKNNSTFGSWCTPAGKSWIRHWVCFRI